jgi:hypothetical protein
MTFDEMRAGLQRGADSLQAGEPRKDAGYHFKVDVKGTPIRSTLTIESTLSAENQARLDEAQQRMADAQARADSARGQARNDRPAADRRADVQDAGEAGSTVASGGSLRGALGGFFGKKLSRAASHEAEDAAGKKSDSMSASAAKGASGSLFKSVTEVESITREAAPAGSFEIPAGYTRKSQP